MTEENATVKKTDRKTFNTIRKSCYYLGSTDLCYRHHEREKAQKYDRGKRRSQKKRTHNEPVIFRALKQSLKIEYI